MDLGEHVLFVHAHPDDETLSTGAAIATIAQAGTASVLTLTLGERGDHIGERTFMKLVVDPASQRVLGAHMIGADAGEIIQGVAIAVKLGATKAQFDATIGIHPTAAEEFVTMRQKTQ